MGGGRRDGPLPFLSPQTVQEGLQGGRLRQVRFGLGSGELQGVGHGKGEVAIGGPAALPEEAEADGVTVDELVNRLLDLVPVP